MDPTLEERIEQKIDKIIQQQEEMYYGLEGLDEEMVKKIIRYVFMAGMKMGYNECSALTQRSYRAIFKFKKYINKEQVEYD